MFSKVLGKERARMKNTSAYAVLTRFGIIAAVLATLVVIAPAVSAADPLEFDYAENGEDPVATFSATDPDADAGDIAWSLKGVDAGLFEIEGGVLTWKDSPSFEAANDADEIPDDEVAGDQGKGDNKYQVTVVASGGEQAVQVTVTDVDEAGKVNFTQPQPQIGRPLMATGGAASDPDGGIDLSEATWQWSRGPTADGPWTDIEGGAAKRASRQPEEADDGMWLRATSSYTDKFGDKTVSGVTENAVEERTTANSRPSFGGLDDSDDATAGTQVARSLTENADGAFGDPVVATDGDNDVLLYSIDSGLDRDIGTAATFSISERTGQLSVKKDGLNFEAAADVLVAAADATATAAGATPDNAAANNEYVVLVRATDPSGAYQTVPVVITVTDANEAPTLTAGSDQKTLYVAEIAPTGLFTAAALTGAPVTYTATDADTDDGDGAITFSLEGADEDEFTIATPTTGDVTIASGAEFDYEGKKELSITLVVTSGGTDAASRGDRERITKLAITVKVQNAEDAGEVEISQPEPQVGRSVFATLEDQDGGQRSVNWKWYRGGNTAMTADELTTLQGTLTAATPPTECTEAAPATATTACEVAEGSPLYTPVADDATFRLHAVATYVDDFVTDTDGTAGDDGDSAVGSTVRQVQVSDPANTAPNFAADQDPSTPGNQADAVRSVAENDKGARVGDPVAATDADGDLMAYTVSGPDAALFKTDNNGQITTAVELDYESLPDDAKYHTIVLTATDPSGASDNVTVIINVTDGPDDAAITSAAVGVQCSGADPIECDYAENGEDPVATFSATDPDADAGDIAWSLKGVDAGLFEIEGGVLTWKDSPSFEAANDADEIPDDEVAGDQGKGDNKYQVTVVASGGEQAVQVTVTDVDEAGKVNFTQPQPQIGRPLMATGGAASDPDGGIDLSEATWQWSRGPTADGPWTDIEGGAAKRASRQPEEADDGMWLRATSSYTDKFGDKTVSGVTENAVEERTTANSRPSFGGLDDSDDATAGTQVARSLTENADGAFGDPVVATDGDNDVLLYSIDSGLDRDIGTAATFSISERTGQLSVKKDGLNFEAAADVLVAAADATATAAGATPDNAAANNEYVVLVRATDPSGAYQTVPVVITVTDANEAPTLTAGSDQKTLYVAEIAPTGLFTAAALTGAPVTYTATDADTDDGDGAITFSLEGADEDEFTIATPTTGDVTIASGAEFDYEGKKELSITLVVTSGGTDAASRGDRERITKLAITVKVQNAEDAGEVEISQPEPQVGRSVFATLEDQDGGQRSVNWKWYRGGNTAMTADELTTLQGTLTAATPPTECTEAAPATATTACEVAEGSPLYTPVADDATFRLHAVATYVDDFVTDTDGTAGDDGDSAVGSTVRQVQVSDPANTAPNFAADQDPSTPGNQADAVRSVAENDKGARVGDPVAATDANGDLMAYTVSGSDAALFKTDNNGQITTAVELDYESLPDDAKYHTIVLTATDPSGASDSVTVIINVTDGPDDAIIVLAGGGPVETTHPCVEGGAVGEDATENLANDCQILLDGMAELVGDGTALNWSAETPMDEWDGVSSGTGRVTSMYLKSHGLAGSIPAGFNGLDALTKLQLHSNALTGEIPDLSDLDNLIWLILQDNSLSGSLPATLGDMDSLDYLYLKNNDLSGDIPMELAGVTTLRRVDVRDNDLTGGIPAGFGSITRLRYLMLSGNMLDGEIPDLSGSSNMTLVYLSDNMLTGSIPASLGSISGLRRLQLHNNMLTGGIPAELGNLSDLQNLLLAGNDFDADACIPAAIIDAAMDADAAGLAACAADDGS